MLNGLSLTLEIVAILLCINFMYSDKIRLKVYDALFIGMEMAIVGSANYLQNGKKIIILSYLIIFLFQLLKFKISTEYVCVNTMVLLSILVVSQLLSSLPTVFLIRYIDTEFLILCNNFFLLLLTILLGKMGSLHKISSFALRYDWIGKVCTFCCFIGAIYLIIVYKVEKYLRPTDYVIFCAWTILIFVMALNWQKSKAKYQAKKRELEVERLYDNYTKELFRTVIKKQHDFDNYLQALLAQFETATTLEELVYNQKRFITGINQDNRFNKLLAGGNSIIIGFLYSKFVNAENLGCKIKYTVKTDTMECAMPQYKIVEIIGILFDNAVEAVAESDIKDVYVRVIEDEDKIDIKISNPSSYVTQNEIQKWLLDGVSTKGENRGIGLNNVMDIVEEYNSDFIICNEEADGTNYLAVEIIVKKGL